MMRSLVLAITVVCSVTVAVSARQQGGALPTGATGSAPTNPALRAELLKMLEEDQRHRKELAETMKEGAKADADRVRRIDMEQAALDEANLQKLVKILDGSGWPTAAAVGADARQGVFLVLQHAPIEVQEKYLGAARNAAAAGELERSNLALLEDRVLMRRGKNQIYGTQLRSNPTTHQLEVWPIDDEANVDARRKAVGLEPLADYVKRFGLTYKPKGA
jgi:hypothetical protein